MHQCHVCKNWIFAFHTFEYWWDELERRVIRRSWEAKHLIYSVRKLSDRLPDYCPGKVGLTDGTLTAALCPNSIPSRHSSNLHPSSLIAPTCQFLSRISPLRLLDLVFSEFREIDFLMQVVLYSAVYMLGCNKNLVATLMNIVLYMF